MDWKHGYFAESGYTYDFHASTSPSRISWLALLKGLKSEKNNFRYLDLGCGQGVSLIHMAALHPDAQFVGVDFIPEHIAHGRDLAKRAGIQNILFIEGDFAELAKEAHLLGEFDYVIAHGITTWVSPEVREALFKLSSSTLKPGGLMYNGYNTYPGWLEMAPFQHLVSLFTNKSNGKNSIQLAKKFFKAMHDAKSPIYEHFPKLSDRLDKLDDLNLSYLMQEYNNKYWAPVYSDQMLSTARNYKLNYVGSVDLVENYDVFIPPALLNIINSEEDVIQRESIRDSVLATGFRRDVYVKGGLQAWPVEKWDLIFEQRFIASGLKITPQLNSHFEVKAGSLDIKGKVETYKPILDSFGTEGNNFHGVLKSNGIFDKDSLVQVISVLMHGGWLELEGSNDSLAPSQLNSATASATLKGAPYNYLCLPKINTSCKISSLDMMMIGLLANSVKPEDLKRELDVAMKKLNIDIKIKEQLNNNTSIKDEIVAMEVKAFLDIRYKNYQRLGAV